MKAYETVTPNPVRIQKIREWFGFKHKLPKDFTFEGELELFSDAWAGTGRSMGRYQVKIIPAERQGKPRIFVIHKGRLVPAGRTAQAKA